MQYEARITSTRTDTANYTHLSLARPEGFSYLPGQYVTLAYGDQDKPRFLALASHPSEDQLLFVSRHGAASAPQVSLSAPQGKGFACDFTNPGNFLHITHGSGISAIRPAIYERLRGGHSGDALLYGISGPEAVPDLDCLNETSGVKQLRAYSKAAKPQHVQDVLQNLDLSLFTHVILIGSKEMMESCRGVLSAKNFAVAAIFSNY